MSPFVNWECNIKRIIQLSKVKHLDGYNRFDLTKLLPEGTDFIGIELGVAAG